MSDKLCISDTTFKRAMRCLAATPTLITTSSEGRRFGMTATAVTAVSAAPPSLLVCVNRGASIFLPLLRAQSFCVNVLDADHQFLCGTFSGKATGEERFGFGDWGNGPENLPYLKGAQANLFCSLEQHSSFATHEIFIGKIAETMFSADVNSLVYLDGQFLRRENQPHAPFI